MKLYTRTILILTHHSVLALRTPVDLTSNQDEGGVCIGDRVVFTCTVTGSGALLWAVESLFSFNEPITFNVFDHEPGTVPDPFPEVFNVTLVNSVQNSTHPGRGNLTSEITILVTSTTLGKHVYCSDGNTLASNSPSIEIQSASKS